MPDNSKPTQQSEPKGNGTPFIDATNAVDAYWESKKWFVPYFDPIDEFERLARNRPSTKISAELPKVTDGTLAAIVSEAPKRVIQQLSTGIVECGDYPLYAKMADIVHRDHLIPMYNRMGDALQKNWSMLSKALTWGRATSYTFFTTTSGIMHTDFVIPYVKDVLTEKGKVFAPDSNIQFMRSWYQRRDIKAIINREKELEAKIKGYKSEWDLKLLSDFIEAGPTAKPADVQTPAEKEKGGDAGGYEVIHAFQKGKDAYLYSFSPKFEKGAPLRAKRNKDPRGAIPLDHLYCNIDHSNPLGRGQVELSGGVQNVIDQQMQMFQYMTTIMMAPPAQIYGVKPAKVKMAPNAIIELPSANAKVDWMKVDNSFLASYPNNYGLLKSQVMNLNSSADHSVSAEAGNPEQSKTPAGVNASEQRLGVSDNYLRRQHESWFNAQAEASINIYFAEMTLDQTVAIKADDVADIQRLKGEEYLKDGQLTIPYKKISGVTFKFHVNASSSEIKEDADNVQKLTEVLKVMQAVPDPTIQGKIPLLVKLIIDEIGAEGTEELFPEFAKDENGNYKNAQDGQTPQPAGANPQQMVGMMQQVAQQVVEQAMQAKDQQKPLYESLQIKFADLPEDAKVQVLAQIGIQTNELSPQQQTIDQNATKTALEVQKTAHQHVMDAHNAVQGAQQHQQDQQFQAEQAAQQPQKPSSQPSSPDTQAAPLDAALSDQEQQIAAALMHRGFNEQDVEQAIVMLRQGVPPQQIDQVLGAKYARG